MSKRLLTPNEVKYLLRKMASLDMNIDPSLQKNKTQKGAKHGVNPTYKPNYAGTMKPALYRKLHKGKKKK